MAIHQISHFVNSGWPKYLSDVETNLKPYWQGKADFTKTDNVLLYNQNIVV